MQFERLFKMHKVIIFPENLKKIQGFTSKLRQSRVTLNTGILLFGLIWRPVYMVKIFFHVTQLRMKFILLINVKMLTIVDCFNIYKQHKYNV